MLRFEFNMRISIIQDAFSPAELLLNSPCCDAQLGADYSAVCFRQLNRKQTIFHKNHEPAQNALSGDLGADTKDHSPDNLAVIRHFAINILAFLDVGKINVSTIRKRKMCGRSPRLLLNAFSRLIYPNPS